MEIAVENDWSTVYHIAKSNLDSTIKSVKFCIACAKRKADKKGIFYHEFECEGSCIKGGQLSKVSEINKLILGQGK